MYTVSREELTKAFESLGVETNLANCSSDALESVTKICQVFFTQMNNAKCNKTSCLNALNTLFMPTLSYRMIATQFIEKQRNNGTKLFVQPSVRHVRRPGLQRTLLTPSSMGHWNIRVLE